MTTSQRRHEAGSPRRRRSRREERRARRGRALRLALAAVAVGVVFVAGAALGLVLDDAPRPGGTQTLVRTLEPDTLPPVTRTVTVTTEP